MPTSLERFWYIRSGGVAAMALLLEIVAVPAMAASSGGPPTMSMLAVPASLTPASRAPASRMPSAAQPFQVAGVTGGGACVALTFDDGPDAILTPRLLSILEEKGAVATFFVVGYRVQAWPDPVRRAANDGDEIGNHSWDHPALPSLGNDTALRELTRTDEVIDKVTGYDPSFTRAPYGSLSSRVAGLSQRRFVAWSVDTLDWLYPDVDRITRAALRAVNGSIILMHDIHPKTIEAVPGIIDGLRARGFNLVTVSQLLGGTCGGQEVGYVDQDPGEKSATGTSTKTSPDSDQHSFLDDSF